MWNVFEKCSLARKMSSWRLTEEVSEPNIVHRLDPYINWRSCKTQWGKYPLDMWLSGFVVHRDSMT